MPKKLSKNTVKSKITFQKEFYSDLTYNDMLYAKTVRAPNSKGIITSINHIDLPEGYFLITARDVPGSNYIDTPCGKIPIFCNGNISYLGEPIALLIGPDEKILEQLLSELIITVDENTIEDYLVEAEESKKSKKRASKKQAQETNKEKEQSIALSQEFFSTEIAKRTIEFGLKGEEFDKIFTDSANTLENEWIYSLNPNNYGEPNGALCLWKDEKNLIIHTPTQWLSNLRTTLTQALNIKNENLTIKKTKTYNRGSNNIWYNSIISCQVAIAAKIAKKAVKLVYTREEQKNFLDRMQTISIKHRTAANEEGLILAMDIEIDANAGFSNPFAQEILDRLVIASCGSYHTKNLRINAKISSSHNPASSFNIQLIDSAAFYAIENQITALAEKYNITPLEIRLKNSAFQFLPKKKQINFPFNFKIERFSQSLISLTQISDYNRKYASYHLDAIKRNQIQNQKKSENQIYKIHPIPLRGIGIACGWEGSGYYGSELIGCNQSIELTLEEDLSVTIHTPPISNSIQEIWTKKVMEILSIPSSKIKISSEFKAGEEPPLPENVYSNISILTDLISKCCEAIKKRKKETPLPYTVKRKINPAKKNEWNKEEFTGTPFHRTSFACATVELEVNPCTYKEKIRNIFIVINAGKILNVNAVEKTIKLGIQKLFSNMLSFDAISYDKIKILFIQSEDDPSQIGELVYQVIPSAYTQALNQALSSNINYLPLQNASIFNEMNKEIEELAETKDQEEKK